MSPYVSFKNSNSIGVTDAPGYHFKGNGRSKALAHAQIRPSPVANLQYHLMVLDREIGYVDGFHESLGFEVGVIGQSRVLTFVLTNMKLRPQLPEQKR